LIGPQRPDGQPRGARETGKRDEEDELLPDRRPAVVNRFRLDVGTSQRIMNVSDPARQSRQFTKYLSENDAPVNARLLDDTGRSQCGCNVGRAADHGPLTYDRSNILKAIDAVLNRDDGGLGTEHRRNERQCGRIVIRLHREDDDIDGTDECRVLFGRRVHAKVAERWTSDQESAFTDRGEMRPSGDEGDVMTGAGEFRTVVAADGTGSQNCNPHNYSEGAVAAHPPTLLCSARICKAWSRPRQFSRDPTPTLAC